MQTRFCRTQIPRTLECVVLVFVLKTNIENFTNKLKSLFCQLSKLLKSYVSYKLLLVNYQSVWTLIVTHLSSLFKSESKLSVSYKEVIQRQVPLALPCYDFTPVMNHKVVSVLPKVKLPTSFAAHSHGVTGGVYKARERIHRGILIHDY